MNILSNDDIFVFIIEIISRQFHTHSTQLYYSDYKKTLYFYLFFFYIIFFYYTHSTPPEAESIINTPTITILYMII